MATYMVCDRETGLYVRAMPNEKPKLTKEQWASKMRDPHVANLLKESCARDYRGDFHVVEK